jgi:hypothetical protein
MGSAAPKLIADGSEMDAIVFSIGLFGLFEKGKILLYMFLIR